MRAFVLILFLFLGLHSKAQDTIVEKATSYHVVSSSTTYEESTKPRYKGGAEAMNKFISDNVVVPGDAKLAGQYGKVYVAFKVMEDGSMADVEVSRGIAPSLDAEAMRVVKTMPNWIPGTKGGDNIAMRYYIPVEFKR